MNDMRRPLSATQVVSYTVKSTHICLKEIQIAAIKCSFHLPLWQFQKTAPSGVCQWWGEVESGTAWEQESIPLLPKDHVVKDIVKDQHLAILFWLSNLKNF